MKLVWKWYNFIFDSNWLEFNCINRFKLYLFNKTNIILRFKFYLFNLNSNLNWNRSYQFNPRNEWVLEANFIIKNWTSEQFRWWQGRHVRDKECEMSNLHQAMWNLAATTKVLIFLHLWLPQRWGYHLNPPLFFGMF